MHDLQPDQRENGSRKADQHVGAQAGGIVAELAFEADQAAEKRGADQSHQKHFERYGRLVRKLLGKRVEHGAMFRYDGVVVSETGEGRDGSVTVG